MKLHIVHQSLDTFMSQAKNVEDVGNVVDMEPDIHTLTETADIDTVRVIRKKFGTKVHVINPDGGDITFLIKRKAAHILHYGGPLAIPRQPGPAREGGHGPRCNSWIEMQFGDEIITHNGVHFVTAHADHTHPGRMRVDQQVKQAHLLGEQMRRQSQGRRIATGSGDLNAVLPRDKAIDDVFNEYGLTTTSEETGVTTGTHGTTRLDYIWTADRDGRVSVASMKVLKSRKYNSDHDPVDVWLNIKEG